MSVKFQGDMLIFCDFIQVYVFTTNHHLKVQIYGVYNQSSSIAENGEKKVFYLAKISEKFSIENERFDS